ncbi:MAG TPA: Flp pilus assembly protein CpaB [Gemmatimonadaceae bacterium]
MRFRSILYAAVLVALLATVGAYRALQATRASDRPTTRPVLVATREIPEGSVIDEAALSLVSWPAAALPGVAYANMDSVVGRVTRVRVLAGDPIVPARLAPTGSAPGLEVRISPGRRAMAVRINDIAGISGFLQPDSRVDVLVSMRAAVPGSPDRQVAKLFMENVRVLSVGTRVERGEKGEPIDATTATLEVTPEEAERLAVAMNQGSIQLVLRAYGDPTTVRTPGASSQDVLAQLRNASTVPVPAPAVPRTERRVAPPARRAPAPVVRAVPAPARDSEVVRVYRGSGEPDLKKFAPPPGGGRP